MKYSFASSPKEILSLTVSTIAALLLFAQAAGIVILLELLILLLVIIYSTLVPIHVSTPPGSLYSRILALIFIGVGFYSFHNTWITSSSTPLLVYSVGLIFCILSGSAFYRLARWMEKLILYCFHTETHAPRHTLKSNWFFPLSCVAFFCLHATYARHYLLGIPIALVFSIIIASCHKDIVLEYRKGPFWLRILAALSSLGICWSGYDCFVSVWHISAVLHRLESFFPVPVNLASVIGILGAVLSLPFVFLCTSVLFRQILDVLKDGRFFLLSPNAPTQRLIYSAVFLVLGLFICVIFTHTNAFYGTNSYYDLIYTSDSPALIRGNVYINLTFCENDLRQPLFAVFSAPLMGIPYLISNLFSLPLTGTALVLNIAQVFLLLLGYLMLVDVLNLTGWKRFLFLILSCCTYPFLLFSLMMEQYIVVFFYLSLFLFRYCRSETPYRSLFWAASGTLLTNAILIPTLSDRHPVRDFRFWFRSMLDRGVEFIVLLLAFCRLDIILDAATNFTHVVGFADQNTPAMQKLYQFTTFIQSCLFAPPAVITPNGFQAMSWQLAQSEALNWFGVILIVLCAISAFVNREKKVCRFSAGWVLFSFLLLFCLGWGVRENGLILYALYFSWAYLVLLHQLIAYLEAHFAIPHLTSILIVLGTAAMAIYNFPAIQAMIQFAIAYYPL